MAVDFKTTHPVEYFRKFVEQDVRPDGRELGQIRPITLNVGSISTAEGSALVKLGNTTVICGIKAELAPPKSEEPTKGFIVPNVDLPPLCSPRFKAGPPSDLAQSCTVFMNNFIKSSQFILPEDLCIEENKLCWALYADLMCLDYDGNILDACCIALLAALKNTQLPIVESNEDTGLIETDINRHQGLKLYASPVCTTFAVFDDTVILVDPTQEEEAIVTGNVTVVTSAENVYMIHKPGGSPLTQKQMQDCIQRAQKHATEVTRLIDETVLGVER